MPATPPGARSQLQAPLKVLGLGRKGMRTQHILDGVSGALQPVRALQYPSWAYLLPCCNDKNMMRPAVRGSEPARIT
jgi:hypothetical protein